MDLFTGLADFVRRTSSYDSLPAALTARSKEMMINVAAAALAGAAREETLAITRFVQEMRGNGKCTIIGMGLRTSPVYAALANGMMARLLDFDDEVTQLDAHPSGAVFPVVMALGEMNGNSGKEVLTAFAIGCELSAKLAATPYLGPTLADAVGASAAAGVLLGLEPAQLAEAFSIAASAPAISGRDPGNALQCGQAAMNGMMAVLLAQQGLGGQRRPTGTLGGSLHPHCSTGVNGEAEFFQQLGNPYCVLQPGVTLKLFPCPAVSHSAIEALLQLQQQYQIEPDQVSSVRLGVTAAALAALPNPCPQTGWEARFSLQYLAGVTLLFGQPLLEQFTDSLTQEPQVRQMMDRVKVDAAETGTEAMPWPSSVSITLTGGRVLEHRAEFARGQPGLPLNEEQLDAKFLYCTRYILPPDHIEGAIGQFRDLENIRDVTGLSSILGG